MRTAAARRRAGQRAAVAAPAVLVLGGGGVGLGLVSQHTAAVELSLPGQQYWPRPRS